MAETGSTNADLLARAGQGAPEGLWLRAERQSAGRGRLGRQWQDAAGNLAASTLVRLRPDDPPAHTLALLAGVAAHEVIARCVTAHDVRLKWPNDVLIDGAKCAGLLLERNADAVIVGFGINIARAPDLPDRRTTSLIAEGADPDCGPGLMVHGLAQVFARRLADWRWLGPDPICAAWVERAHPVGSAIAVSDGSSGRIEGRFLGLERDGALRIETPNGPLTVRAGDVELLDRTH